VVCCRYGLDIFSWNCGKASAEREIYSTSGFGKQYFLGRKIKGIWIAYAFTAR